MVIIAWCDRSAFSILLCGTLRWHRSSSSSSTTTTTSKRGVGGARKARNVGASKRADALALERVSFAEVADEVGAREHRAAVGKATVRKERGKHAAGHCYYWFACLPRPSDCRLCGCGESVGGGVTEGVSFIRTCIFAYVCGVLETACVCRETQKNIQHLRLNCIHAYI